MSRHILDIISRLRIRNGTDRIPVSPALCILSVLTVIVLTVLSENMFFVSCMAAMELLILSFADAAALRRVLSVTCAAALLSFLITLPSVLLGSPHSPLILTAKVTVTVLAVCIQGEILSFASWIRGLAALHVPAAFLLTLDLTVRFIDELAHTAKAMSEAMQLRSVGSKSNSRVTVGGILGTLYLMVMKRSSETYEAMICRCFDGSYRTIGKHKRSRYDVLPLVIIMAALVLFFVLEVGR